MACRHRLISRLHHRAAGVVQVGAHVGELDKVVEIFELRFAAPAIQVNDKGRSIDGGKNGLVAADHHIVGRVARQLGKVAGRHADIFHHQFFVKEGCLTDHFGPMLLQNGAHFGVIHVNAQVAQNPHRFVVDALNARLIDQIITWHIVANLLHGRAGGGIALTFAPFTTAFGGRRSR